MYLEFVTWKSNQEEEKAKEDKGVCLCNLKANVARCIIELEKKNYLKTKYCNNKPLQCFKLEQHLVESLIDKTNKQK